MEKALDGFLKSAKLAPGDSIPHYNAAVIYYQLDAPQQAAHHYNLAHEANPKDPDILFNLAITLKQLGRIQEALDCYYTILEIAPHDTAARYNLGILLMESGLLEEAADFFREVLAADTAHASACNNLAYLYHRWGMTAEALETYNQLLEIDPFHKTASHMQAALAGKTPDQPPAEYIRDVFDHFQDYDSAMQDSLGYYTPWNLLDLLRESLPEKKWFNHILDLGCGTGLSGSAFRSMTESLTGIDLSLTMLAQAEEKQIYDELRQTEIISFLRSTERHYDLFLAADVFVYHGDLFPVMEEISKRCRPGGLVLFSTELAEKGFLLRETGRYAHSVSYVQDTAEQCGLNLLQSRVTDIRKERGEWLKGGLYLFACQI